MFYGRGAGGGPTASAVLGDLVDAAVNRTKGTAAAVGFGGRARIRPIDEQRSPFYLSLDVEDRPGVLRSIAEVFETHDVSIRSLEQEGIGADARIVLITHVAREADLRATVRDLRGLPTVHEVGSVIRVVANEE
jgi:homoserine dehydrogenase